MQIKAYVAEEAAAKAAEEKAAADAVAALEAERQAAEEAARAAHEAALAAWVHHIDPESGASYWHNEASGATCGAHGCMVLVSLSRSCLP